jgi:hypothetical protein
MRNFKFLFSNGIEMNLAKRSGVVASHMARKISRLGGSLLPPMSWYLHLTIPNARLNRICTGKSHGVTLVRRTL